MEAEPYFYLSPFALLGRLRFFSQFYARKSFMNWRDNVRNRLFLHRRKTSVEALAWRSEDLAKIREVRPLQCSLLSPPFPLFPWADLLLGSTCGRRAERHRRKHQRKKDKKEGKK